MLNKMIININMIIIRSDGTLNPSGVRFGSAEIYNIVEQFPEVIIIIITTINTTIIIITTIIMIKT